MRWKSRLAKASAVLLLAAIGSFSGAEKNRAGSSELPHINGPAIYGERPNHPFLYRIPATGARPMRFSAEGLPYGLTLDSHSGIISGIATHNSSSLVRLRATNAHGTVVREFQIIIGDKLALTPPMGWNGWNVLQTETSDAKVRAQADALVSSGLADHGYSFINLDDGWEEQVSGTRSIGGPRRNPQGAIKSNHRFPDMNALTDYIHSKGLKAGIYSTPGPRTCVGFEGSYEHEEQDGAQIAEWGFDFLKYDLCSYPLKDHSPEESKKPFEKMGQILARQNRDILYSLSEYGSGDVWKWGREVGAQMWRTGGDLAWGEKGVYSSWDNIKTVFDRERLSPWAGPGGWNDPDFLLIGDMAYVPYNQKPPDVKIDRIMPPPLTPDEQLTQLSLWSLMSAPLIIGGDLTTIDRFALSLLSNDEVIAIDQDSLGRPARVVAQNGDLSIWAKDLEDGSKAVGLFNLGEREENSTARWSDLGITGDQVVRDLWKRQDIGIANGSFTIMIPPHGVRLLTLLPLRAKSSLIQNRRGKPI